MIKQSKYWYLFLLISLLSESSLLSQNTPRIEQVNTQINASDGLIDPLWDNIEFFTNENDYYESNPQVPDFEVKWKGAYNASERELYLLIHIIDDSVTTNEQIHIDSAYNAEHISIYIDLFGGDFPHNNEGNYYFNFLPFIDGYTCRIGESSFDSGDWGFIDGIDKELLEEGWFLELLIAFENMTQEYDLNYIDTIGIDIAVSDNDLGRGERKHRLSWSTIGTDVWSNPSLLGKLVIDDKADDTFKPYCQADFSYVDFQNSINEQTTIRYSDKTITNDEIKNWSWTFDDNYASYKEPVSYYEETYGEINAGTETCLFITTKHGCNSSVCKSIVLEPRFELYGNINSQDNALTNWNVFAFQKEGTSYTLLDQVLVIDNSFEFTKFKQGNYLLYAIPDEVDTKHIPTYFVLSEKWQNADIIPISSNVFDVDIHLNDVKFDFVGVGTITGRISKWQGGVPIIIAGKNGIPLNYTLTNRAGRFNLENVPYGTYILYPEYPEWDNSGVSIELSPENPIKEDVVFDKRKSTSLLVAKLNEDFQVRYLNDIGAIEVVPITNQWKDYDILIYAIDGRKLYHQQGVSKQTLFVQIKGSKPEVVLINIVSEGKTYVDRLVLTGN